MPVKYKVVAKKPGIGGQLRYYPVLTDRLVTDLNELCDRISEQSTFSRADVKGVVEAFIQQIPWELGMGRNVRLDGLGTFSVHATSKGKEDPSKVTLRDISGLSMSFLPDKQIKHKLKAIKFEKV